MAMKRLKTGDPCPCCGQPIKTKDEETLYLLSWIGHKNRLPSAEEIRVIHNLYESGRKEAGCSDG